MVALSKYADQLTRERDTSGFIPYSNHVSEEVIITTEGDYMRTWRVGGIPFETTDAEDIFRAKDQLNTLLRSIGSDHVAVWSHNIRRRTNDKLDSVFENEFSQTLNDRYFDSFSRYKMMSNELYLTVVYRPLIGQLSKAARKAGRRSVDEIRRDQQHAIKKINEIAAQIESSLKRYDIEPLRTYEKDNTLYSNYLTFLNYLLTGEWQEVRVPKSTLNVYLGNAWVYAGTETIEIRTPTTKRFAQGIDFKDYCSHTEPGMLNGLAYENYEYVITQSYSFFSKSQGQSYLQKQAKQLGNADDGSLSQIEEMQDAVDQLIQGEFCMGEYHYSLMIFGDTVEEVVANRTSAMAIIQDLGFIAALINTATDAAFYAQLPCNFRYRPRVAGLTSKNFASFSPFHNFATGKRDGNPWGQAVTLFKSPSGQPLYFNYHYSKLKEDAYDKKPLGNTRIIGQSGAGKTVLMTHLLCQGQKYKHTSKTGYTDVFFDKDRGAELVIRAIGGKYLAVKNGKPTGMNPFQMEPDEANILFLERLVKVLANADGPLSATDEQRISHAVRAVMRMPKPVRRLSIVLQNLPEGNEAADKENSIARRLSKWCVDNGDGKKGSLWWALDCPEDQIDFTSHTSYGFDGTDFLDNKEIRTPLSMYLLHRMESVIDGRRFIYFMDEAWKWIDDPAFGDFAGNKQLTIRKQNGLGVFATQMPSSFLQSKQAAALVQQCATEIYLPNPKADYSEYINGFKVTEAEYQIIKNLDEESRMFLVKQGQSSCIGWLDLDGLDDELAILSGSTDNIELLDSIIEELGSEDPKLWIPVFHERRKARALRKEQGVNV